jgi:hypothetical protein
MSKAFPPCVTPSTPSRLTPKTEGPTSILVIWSQPANTGSLITSYTIFWGTTSGVYTNSAVVGASPKTYTITGLTSGTQYFFAIQANSSAAAGCQSALSSENTATTTGAAPGNHLLNGLISYWKFDDNQPAGLTTADAIGGNPLLLGPNTTTTIPGKINLGLALGVGSSHANHVDNADFSPAANTSFSFSVWLFSTDWTSGVVLPVMFIKGTVGGSPTIQLLVDVGGGNNLNGFVWSSAGNPFGGTLATVPTANVFHHIVVTFDSPNSQIRGYYDGVLKYAVATDTASLKLNASDFQVGVGAGFPAMANMTADEMGMWHRALTQTDVTNIFNGGACLPLSSYTA